MAAGREMELADIEVSFRKDCLWIRITEAFPSCPCILILLVCVVQHDAWTRIFVHNTILHPTSLMSLVRHPSSLTGSGRIQEIRKECNNTKKTGATLEWRGVLQRYQTKRTRWRVTHMSTMTSPNVLHELWRHSTIDDVSHQLKNPNQLVLVQSSYCSHFKSFETTDLSWLMLLLIYSWPIISSMFFWINFFSCISFTWCVFVCLITSQLNSVLSPHHSFSWSPSLEFVIRSVYFGDFNNLNFQRLEWYVDYRQRTAAWR